MGKYRDSVYNSLHIERKYICNFYMNIYRNVFNRKFVFPGYFARARASYYDPNFYSLWIKQVQPL